MTYVLALAYAVLATAAGVLIGHRLRRAGAQSAPVEPPGTPVTPLRAVRLADVTDHTESYAWDEIAGAEPWRGMLAAARLRGARDDINRRKAA